MTNAGTATGSLAVVRRKPASVLILGSGPVVIGQAAEFDYAGTQACRALRAEGVRTILVNSNPATIMTDPDVADAIYLEPLTVDAIEAVIARERPEGLLAGLGGQTALNLAMALSEAGQQALRLLLGDDRLDGLDGQRLEVDRIGDLRIGHDRRRIAVDEDHLQPFGAHRLARLTAGVVELARLSDDDRTGADDEDALQVGSAWHLSRDWALGAGC